MSLSLKESIGIRVKAARLFCQLTQVQLAEKIGRTEETVSNIERAVTAPKIETLERLSHVLCVPMCEFFEAYDDKHSSKKRLALELDIRESLRTLSIHELSIAKKQIRALVGD